MFAIHFFNVQAMKSIFLIPALLFMSIFQSVILIGQTKDVKAEKATAKRQPYKLPEAIPVEDFFRNPEKSDFKISPSGNRYAYLASEKGRMNIFVQSLKIGEPKQLTLFEDQNITRFEWVTDNIIVFLKDAGSDGNCILHFLNVSLGKVGGISPAGSMAEIVEIPENDTTRFFYSTNQRDPQIFDLYEFDVKTSTSSLYFKNLGNYTSWLFDHSGELRLATSAVGLNKALNKIVAHEKGVEVRNYSFTDDLTPLFFDFDNVNVYCSSNLERDKNAIVRFNIESGKEEILFEHPEVDVYSLNYSPKRKVLTYINYETDKIQVEYLDEYTQRFMTSLKTKLPRDVEFEIINSDRAEKKLIIRTYSDVSLGAYFLYDVESSNLKLLETLSPWLDESGMMCQMKPITFENRNGETIHGYLTLPKSGSQMLPLIVKPHDGPWARDSWGFNPEVQFLASRGYAVLHINFRGSTGYGKTFCRSAFNQWGQLMQEDIEDGVSYVVHQRIADPKLVGIYGGSNDGYATLFGLAISPDFYTCGIDYLGVSSLSTFHGSAFAIKGKCLRKLNPMVVDPISDETAVKENSASYISSKITSPILAVGGVKDGFHNKQEVSQMIEALKTNGVKVEYYLEPKDGQGFRNEENRFKFYQALEVFLVKHLRKTPGNK
jgi:dipeptidyl aminopeptidase/acylaminoacyl peptidase